MLWPSCNSLFFQVVNFDNRNHDYFLSGGEDKMLMLWKYDEGFAYYKGQGHAGHIRKVILTQL